MGWSRERWYQGGAMGATSALLELALEADAEAVHAAVEGLAAEAELGGGAGDDAGVGLEGGDDGAPLGLGVLVVADRPGVGLGDGVVARAARVVGGDAGVVEAEVAGFDDAAVAQEDRALDPVLQLADVAGPVVAEQRADGGGAEAGRRGGGDVARGCRGRR